MKLNLSLILLILPAIALAQQTKPADSCGNTDPKRACLVWDYAATRRNGTPFLADQAKSIFIVYQDQSPRIIAAPLERKFVTAPCVKGNYYIYIEDQAGYISDWSNKIYLDTTSYCSPPLAPTLKGE